MAFLNFNIILFTHCINVLWCIKLLCNIPLPIYFATVKKWCPILLVVIALAAGIAYVFIWQKPENRRFFRNAAPIAPKLDPAYKQQLYERLDSFFTDRSESHGFSGSVLVSVKGEPVYENCFGYCDYRSKDLMADTIPFQLASASKPFTATAILWLVEQGKLSLDDSIQKFFPNLPYKGVTIKLLLCHRSGLPNYLYFCDRKATGNVDYITNADVLSIMARLKPSPYALPDRKFEYCNTNYVLLAAIAEQVTGMKYDDFMQETFFTPLGMTHTFVYDIEDSTDRKIAISYNSKWQIQHDDIYDGVTGDKGIYSTVHDMFLWDMAYYEGKLLSNEMMQEAYKPRSFEKPGMRNYGYGWRLSQKPDSTYLVYHNGWWHGNNTVFCRNVQDTTAIIILSNKFNKSVYNVKPVWEILYGISADSLANEE